MSMDSIKSEIIFVDTDMKSGALKRFDSVVDNVGLNLPVKILKATNEIACEIDR